MRENTAYLYGQLTRDPICYKNPSTQELLSGQITIKTARRTNATGELFVKGRLRIDFITIYSVSYTHLLPVFLIHAKVRRIPRGCVD